jgi:hypothetical protein
LQQDLFGIHQHSERARLVEQAHVAQVQNRILFWLLFESNGIHLHKVCRVTLLFSITAMLNVVCVVVRLATSSQDARIVALLDEFLPILTCSPTNGIIFPDPEYVAA